MIWPHSKLRVVLLNLLLVLALALTIVGSARADLRLEPQRTYLPIVVNPCDFAEGAPIPGCWINEMAYP